MGVGESNESGGEEMAQFVAFDPNVEVNGETVWSIVDGMGLFTDQALTILRSNGIGDPKPGTWHSQQAWLDAFKVIAEKVGPATLHNIGQRIPDNAQFPPEIDHISKALGAIDVAYHMNHRVGGEPLFDPASGEMREGIGNYGFSMPEDRVVHLRCDNPYPCDFDQGIIGAMARRFKPKDGTPRLTHHTDGCRKSGAESCLYIVTW